MAYGGLVVGWLARTNHRFGFGAKALVGGGQATLSNTIVGIVEMPDDRDGPFGRGPSPPREHPIIQPNATTRVRFHDGFFIADPEANLLVNLTHRLRLTGGVGYRLISGARGTDDRLEASTARRPCTGKSACPPIQAIKSSACHKSVGALTTLN